MENTAALSEIVEVVRTYIEGMAAGDRARLEEAFFPDASEVGHFEGELLWNSREGFISMCEEAAAEASFAAQPWAILGISVVGEIASVHVENRWAGMQFDDIMTLINHDGRWRIISKVFRIRD